MSDFGTPQWQYEKDTVADSNAHWDEWEEKHFYQDCLIFLKTKMSDIRTLWKVL